MVETETLSSSVPNVSSGLGEKQKIGYQRKSAMINFNGPSWVVNAGLYCCRKDEIELKNINQFRFKHA